jgi:hypothetical protein
MIKHILVVVTTALLILSNLSSTILAVVRVRGADLMHQDFINTLTHGYYDAIGSYRKTVNYDAAANGFPIVRVQAAVRVNGDYACAANAPFACSNFFSAGITTQANSTTDTSGTAGVGELVISSDGKVYGYNANAFVPGCPGNPPPASCVASFLVTAPVTLGTYHVLAVNMDFNQNKFAFCLDGGLLGVPFPFHSDANTDILRRGSLVIYARADTAQLHKTSFRTHDDNFSITTLSAAQTLTSCD